MTRITLIAPAGVASAHGVVDQARLLVTRLLDLGHDADLIVVRAPRATQPTPSPDPDLRSRERTVPVGDVWTHVDGSIDVLWVHWANFGLAEWRHVGSPLGFARQLRTWRAAHRSVRLALSVHEGWEQPVFTQQPVHRLRGLLQRPPLALVLPSADGVAVNCDRWLDRVARRSTALVVKLPTPSNFPRPSVPPAPDGRRDLVVMGGPGERSRLLETLRHDAAWRAAAPGATSVHSIGADPGDEADIQGLPVVSHGYLDAVGVGDVLATCALGVIGLPEDVVDKSTAAATYRTHGLATLNVASGRVEPAGSVAPTTIDDLVTWVLHV